MKTLFSLKSLFILCLLGGLFFQFASGQKPSQEKGRAVYNVAILEFQSKVPAIEADTLADIFAAALTRIDKDGIKNSKKVGDSSRCSLALKSSRLLKEMSFQASGITDVKQAVEMGQLLNARYIIEGTVIKVGSDNIYSLQMLDVATGEIVGGASTKTKNPTKLFDENKNYALASELVTLILRKEGKRRLKPTGAMWVNILPGFGLGSFAQGRCGRRRGGLAVGCLQRRPHCYRYSPHPHGAAGNAEVGTGSEADKRRRERRHHYEPKP